MTVSLAPSLALSSRYLEHKQFGLVYFGSKGYIVASFFFHIINKESKKKRDDKESQLCLLFQNIAIVYSPKLTTTTTVTQLNKFNNSQLRVNRCFFLMLIGVILANLSQFKKREDSLRNYG